MRCRCLVCWWVCNVNAIVVQNEFRHIFVSSIGSTFLSHKKGLIYDQIDYIRLSFSCVCVWYDTHRVIKSPWQGCENKSSGIALPWLIISCRAKTLTMNHLAIVCHLHAFFLAFAILWPQWVILYLTITVVVADAAAAGLGPGCRSRSSAGWSPRAWPASLSAPGPPGRARSGGSTCLTWGAIQYFIVKWSVIILVNAWIPLQVTSYNTFI